MTLKKPKVKYKSTSAKKKQKDQDAKWKEQNSAGEEEEGENEVSQKKSTRLNIDPLVIDSTSFFPNLQGSDARRT